MIGDNPEGDIRGANRVGWRSVLVRTGIFEMRHPGAPNDPEDPARYVEEDVVGALARIRGEEGL